MVSTRAVTLNFSLVEIAVCMTEYIYQICNLLFSKLCQYNRLRPTKYVLEHIAMDLTIATTLLVTIRMCTEFTSIATQCSSVPILCFRTGLARIIGANVAIYPSLKLTLTTVVVIMCHLTICTSRLYHMYQLFQNM